MSVAAIDDTAVRPRRLERRTWRALGTRVDLLVLGGDAEPVREAVDRVLRDVDACYSRFRDDSEISTVNARAGESVALSPLLSSAIEAALRSAQLSDGLVDPTVGHAMRVLGYDSDFEAVARRTDPIRLRIERIPGWRALRFDPRLRRLLAPRGVELDLGSSGKALAADVAAAAALGALSPSADREPGEPRPGVLVSLGGDLAVAGRPPAGGWRVLATEDCDAPPDGAGEVVAIRDGAMATSSTTVRRWHRGTTALHHIVDPRTGLPASGPWRTVSVIAATCVDANAAATGALVRGESAPWWLESAGLAARLVGNDGQVLRVGGWPSPRSEGRS
jgi:FAD:protein FMN transferase